MAAEPASTVKLLTTDIQVAADGTYTQTNHYEITANNDSAALRVGQTSLPYDSSSQEVHIVEAHTLKPDGKTIPVNPDAIYDQMPSGLAPGAMITDLRVKEIVFPQFAAGDVAVYTVTVATKTSYFPGKFWFSQVFPRSVAFGEVRESITAPRNMPLQVENHGVDFRKTEKGATITYSWHYSAPTPVAMEYKPVSPMDSEPRFLVTSFKDFAELGQAYAAISKPKMTPTPQVTALADKITAGIADRRDQAKAIYEWVSKNIRYVAIELGRGSFVPHDPDAIISNGYGDCKDHVVVLGALLKAKGIESESILINGGNNYTLPKVPTYSSFDHVISWVPEFNLYLDSSITVAPFGVLGAQEYGKPIIRATLTGAGADTLPVVPAGLATQSTRSDTVLDEDGQLSGSTTSTATGPYAVMLRMIGLGIQNAGAEAAAAHQLTVLGYPGATGSFDIGAPTDLAPSYAITSHFSSSGWKAQASGTQPFHMPGGLRIFGLAGDGALGPLKPGQFADSEPVVCATAHMSEDLSLALPSGMQVAHIPPDANIETPYLHFVAHWVMDANKLTVHRDFDSTIDRPLCSADIRERNALALSEIEQSYNFKISLVPASSRAAQH